MSFQAYLDNIEEKTGLTPRQFIKLAHDKGFDAPAVKAGAIVERPSTQPESGNAQADRERLRRGQERLRPRLPRSNSGPCT